MGVDTARHNHCTITFYCHCFLRSIYMRKRWTAIYTWTEKLCTGLSGLWLWKKKSQLNVWYFLYKIVYINWMSCFLEERYFATLKFRQHEECLELLINKRLLFQTFSSNQNMTQQERSPLPGVQLNGAGPFPEQGLEFHGVPQLTECLEKAALMSTPRLSQQHAVKRGHVILLSNFEDKIAHSV